MFCQDQIQTSFHNNLCVGIDFSRNLSVSNLMGRGDKRPTRIFSLAGASHKNLFYNAHVWPRTYKCKVWGGGGPGG